MMAEDDLKQAMELLSLPSEAPALQGLSDQDRSAIMRHRQWTRGRNIVGFGIADRTTAGATIKDSLTLKVYVASKERNGAITAASRVPRRIHLPTLPEEIVPDVEAIGRPALQTLKSRVRPLAAGCSVGLAGGVTGTLGAIVAAAGASSVPLLLSNCHIFAQSGLAPIGAQVVQPGPEDGGAAPQDVIGAMSAFVGLNFEAGYNNLCDAAVASVAKDIAVDAMVPELKKIVGAPLMATRGMQVQKVGRSSGLTTGVVRDVNYRSFMDYPTGGGGQTGAAGFRDQVLCDHYADPGDSGSAVFAVGGGAVGLHWCGSAVVSIFSPLAFVFQALSLVPFVAV